MPSRYYSQKDIDTIKKFNQELVGDLNAGKDGIIYQPVVIYKISAYDTEVNMYGETADGKVYKPFNFDMPKGSSMKGLKLKFYKKTQKKSFVLSLWFNKSLYDLYNQASLPLRWYKEIASRDAVLKGYDMPSMGAAIPIP